VCRVSEEYRAEGMKGGVGPLPVSAEMVKDPRLEGKRGKGRLERGLAKRKYDRGLKLMEGGREGRSIPDQELHRRGKKNLFREART